MSLKFMKIKLSMLIMAAIVMLTLACAFQNNFGELKTGKYVLQDEPSEDWAWVLLDDKNEFQFNRDSATSYRPVGKYSVENNELILRVNDDEVYRFEIKGSSLVFKSGEYAEGLLESGTVFELTKDN